MAPSCPQVMEIASCTLLVSTCGVFRTQTWSWGRRSAARSRRRTHATSNSAGNWSLWNLRNLWRQGFAMTLGYVWVPPYRSMVPEGHSGPFHFPLRSIWLTSHMNQAQQSILSGKHQKTSVGLTWGFHHYSELWGSLLPGVGLLDQGLSFGISVFASLIDLSLLCWASQSNEDCTSPFLVTSLEFLCTFGWGVSLLDLRRDFFFFWKQVLSLSSSSFEFAL